MLAVEGLRGESHTRVFQVCFEEQAGVASSKTKPFEEVEVVYCAGEAKVNKERNENDPPSREGGISMLHGLCKLYLYVLYSNFVR